MSKSTIEWTDFTWNPVTGCNKVSAGCKNCYAETIANRFWKDRKFTDVQIHPDRLDQPLKLKKPHMIFVNSMSDLFHENIPMDFLIHIFRVMQTAPWHTFQVLTKRPDVMLERLKNIYVPANVWLGVSVEDQKTALERIPLLMQVQSEIKWLSIEPLIGPVNLDAAQMMDNKLRGRELLSWVVVGCESGPKRRECKIDWVGNLVTQCLYVGIPVFVKQLQINGNVTKDINDFPENLRVRKYPTIKQSNNEAMQ